MSRFPFNRACTALLVLAFTLSLSAHAASENLAATGAGMRACTDIAGCNSCIHDNTTSSSCHLQCLNLIAIGQTVTAELAGGKPSYESTSFRFIPALLVYTDLDPARQVTTT